jgi:hypothetical protein
MHVNAAAYQNYMKVAWGVLVVSVRPQRKLPLLSLPPSRRHSLCLIFTFACFNHLRWLLSMAGVPLNPAALKPACHCLVPFWVFPAHSLCHSHLRLEQRRGAGKAPRPCRHIRSLRCLIIDFSITPQLTQTLCQFALFLCAGETTITGNVYWIIVFDSAHLVRALVCSKTSFQAALGHQISMIGSYFFDLGAANCARSHLTPHGTYSTPTVPGHGLTTARHSCWAAVSRCPCDTHIIMSDSSHLISFPPVAAKCPKSSLCL